MHGTRLEHRFECHGFWHAIGNHISNEHDAQTDSFAMIDAVV